MSGGAVIPQALTTALAAIAPPPQFAQRAKRLIEQVQHGSPVTFTDDHDRTAYALSRMPATAAAVAFALSQGGVSDLTSVVDLGSGCGAGLWAAAERCRPGARLVGVDRDEGLLTLARTLAASGPDPLPKLISLHADLSQPRDYGRADLVVLSHLCGELSDELRPEVVRRAWSQSSRWLVIVEPGTPQGHQTILAIRRVLNPAGAAIAAPCPHRGRCPLAEGPQWCHTDLRLTRSAAKNREITTIEPVSYLVAERISGDHRPGLSRIVAEPVIAKTTAELTLCGPTGLEQRRISNRMGQRWQRAKLATWGGAFDDRADPG